MVTSPLRANRLSGAVLTQPFLPVFGINTRVVLCPPWFLAAVECCTGGCPQSTCRPDRHVCIACRPSHASSRPRGCQFCSCHGNNCTGTFILSPKAPSPAHVVLGRIDLLRFGLYPPGFHRRCPVSRTSSRICYRCRGHYTHVSAPRPNHVTHVTQFFTVNSLYQCLDS